MTINKKIGVLALVPVLALGIMAAIAFGTLNDLSTKAEEILVKNVRPLVKTDIPSLTALQASMKNMLEADRDAHQALIAEKMSLASSDDSEMNAATKSHQENIEQARARMEKSSKAFGDEQLKLYQDFKSAFAQWQEKTNKVVNYADDSKKIIFARRISYGSASRTFNAMRDYIDKLTQMQEVRIKNVLEGVQSRASHSETNQVSFIDQAQLMTWIFMIIAIVSIPSLLFFAWLLSGSITRPITQAVNRLSEVANISSKASKEMAASSQYLAEGSSEQAASLEESSASLQEITGMTRENAENAGSAKSVVASAGQLASDGKDSMVRMQEAIENIKESSDQTGQIIKTIDEIAFQTNLLALNAAVEAARAGEAGRGFAVVAEEVRNLAKRSADAARDTNTLIEQAQVRADHGVEVAREVEAVLEKISGGVGKAESLVSDIASSNDEQAKAVDQVAVTVVQMESITQKTASTAEETAAASEELTNQVQELLGVVSDLRQIIGNYQALAVEQVESLKKPTQASGGYGAGNGNGHGSTGKHGKATFLELDVQNSISQETPATGLPSYSREYSKSDFKDIPAVTTNN